MKFASDNNSHDLVMICTSLKRFLGIFILTGYHITQQVEIYRGKDEDKEGPTLTKWMNGNGDVIMTL